MPEVTVKKVGGFKPIRVVVSGDLVLIDEVVYMASGFQKMKLICLSNGSTWCDDEFTEGTTEKGLKNFINDGDEDGPYVFELIKSNEYKINIEMK